MVHAIPRILYSSLGSPGLPLRHPWGQLGREEEPQNLQAPDPSGKIHLYLLHIALSWNIILDTVFCCLKTTAKTNEQKKTVKKTPVLFQTPDKVNNFPQITQLIDAENQQGHNPVLPSPILGLFLPPW